MLNGSQQQLTSPSRNGCLAFYNCKPTTCVYYYPRVSVLNTNWRITKCINTSLKKKTVSIFILAIKITNDYSVTKCLKSLLAKTYCLWLRVLLRETQRGGIWILHHNAYNHTLEAEAGGFWVLGQSPSTTE